jgi:hypothetical protein
VPHRVDAAVKAGLLDLIDRAVKDGWDHRPCLPDAGVGRDPGLAVARHHDPTAGTFPRPASLAARHPK